MAEESCGGYTFYNEGNRNCMLWTDVCSTIPCVHSKHCSAPCEGMDVEQAMKRDAVYLLTTSKELMDKYAIFNAVNLFEAKACPRYESTTVKVARL